MILYSENIDLMLYSASYEVTIVIMPVFIFISGQSNVTLELITAQGYDRLCPLFCVDKQLRRRRAAGTIKSLQFILESIRKYKLFVFLCPRLATLRRCVMNKEDIFAF